MKEILIAAISLIGAFLIAGVILTVALAWTHYPQGIIRAWRQRRKELKKHGKNC